MSKFLDLMKSLEPDVSVMAWGKPGKHGPRLVIEVAPLDDAALARVQQLQDALREDLQAL